MLKLIYPRIFVSSVGSEEVHVSFLGKGSDFLMVDESLPLSAEIAFPHPGTCCTVQLSAMPRPTSRNHPIPHLSHGNCDSQSKPTEYQRSVGSFLSMASLSMLPHLINSRNAYVKNLVCRWRKSSPYTIGNLNSNLKITASLDLD